ncbi:alpha/beta fold hydrolase [Veronia pacifica]|uniref:AB hydrolase-1 domain-containing protein n=1 Tax=Veronia pacifica TaxID=1080227 RepID=A0A1C3EJ79_9GAMM|nr:alpha/beta fold hydrolase [Veronia pacifica]ODA33296.1 hypothetical protein A8L45_10885 [Veronia pacifica]
MKKSAFALSPIFLGLMLASQVGVASTFRPYSTPVDCPDMEEFENAQCFNLTVPADYDHIDPVVPDVVDLFYSVSPVKNPNERSGALLMNFGGPGMPASSEAAVMVQDLKESHERRPEIGYDELNEHFDIIGLDPRGTGGSAFAEAFGECAYSEQGCLSTFESLAPYMGTNTAAKDMDALRQVLGEDKISFIGYSYGTRIGTVYADMYPEHVEKLILDSAMHPEKTQADDLYFSSLEAFEQVMRFRLAEAGRNVNADMQKLKALIADFDHIEWFVTTDGERIRPHHFYSLLGAVRSVDIDETWEAVKQPLFSLLDQDLGAAFVVVTESLIERKHEELEEWKKHYNAVRRAVTCTDEHSGKPMTEKQFRNKSGIFGSYVFNHEANMCHGWSAITDPVVIPADLGSKLNADNVMVVGAKNDPETPFYWSQAMRSIFGDSAVFHEIDQKVEHGLIFSFNPNPELDKAAIEFLLR